MRRFILLLTLATVSLAQDKLILSAQPSAKPMPKASCAVQQLYLIGWGVHDPEERHKVMLAWLDASSCSSEQLVGIWNSLAALAGTADSVVLRSKVIDCYERAVEREKK